MKLVDLLIEGGFASSLTQNTALTPNVVEECVVIYNRFVVDFNKYLSNKSMPNVKAGTPVGSSKYYKKDLQSNPKKEYGDVDMLFYIPKMEELSDNKNKTLYYKEIEAFTEGRDDIKSTGENFIIVKLKNGEYAQIDLVSAYWEDRDWIEGRMTPEYGTKGAVGGYMYSALAEVLNLTMGGHSGAQMKIKGGKPVKFTTPKYDELLTVSRSIKTFGLDICRKYFELAGEDPKKMKVSDSLRKNPGVNPKDMKNSDIALTIKAIGDTLELNDLFGNGALSHLSSKEDYMEKIRTVYEQKMKKAIESSKFDKAYQAGEIGAKKADKAKETLRQGMEKALQYLS